MALFWSVPLIRGMANGAFPAGVVWVNHSDWNTRFPCLVFHERPELVERPRIMDVPVALHNGCPHPYAAEVFNGNRGRGPFGFPNDLLRYYIANKRDNIII